VFCHSCSLAFLKNAQKNNARESAKISLAFSLAFILQIQLEAFELSELGCLEVSRNKPVLLDVYWFFSKASCWDFGSHSFASALGAQV
jgi:hypothetical protein